MLRRVAILNGTPRELLIFPPGPFGRFSIQAVLVGAMPSQSQG